MADTEPDRCQCGEDHDQPAASDGPSPDEAAFYDAMSRYLIDGHAPISVEFMAGAITGYTLRRHVNEAHPDQVEFVADNHAPTDATREGWLFGFRFEHHHQRA
jgi:hypothetical protein